MWRWWHWWKTKSKKEPENISPLGLYSPETKAVPDVSESHTAAEQAKRMVVIYKILLYGDAAPEGISPKEASSIRYDHTSWEFCCNEMADFVDRVGPSIQFPECDSLIIYSFGIGYQVGIKYCPFCGSKIIFSEGRRLKQIKLSKAPRIYYEYAEVPVDETSKKPET